MKVNNENRYHYPVEPGQFLTMLNRVGQLGQWYVRHSPSWNLSITSFSLSPGAGNLPNEASLFFVEGELPAVKLGKITFDLMDLFKPGEAWDPKVYTNNPYMPYPLKEFLDQLFAVLMLDREMRRAARPRAMSLAA
jgi:hypothetical protein